MPDPDGDQPCLLTLSAAILQAYVRSNPVPPSALPSLLSDIGRALRTLRTELSGPEPALADQPPVPTPSIPISKTIGRDYIISLEDGQKYRSLKRHLKSRGMTGDEYRAKWGLDADYPLVAPSLSALRADQARSRAKKAPPPLKAKRRQIDGHPTPIPA